MSRHKTGAVQWIGTLQVYRLIYAVRKLRALSPSKVGTGYFRVQLPDLKSAECGGPAHVVPGLIVTLGT
jgi:hypothetical protein